MKLNAADPPPVVVKSRGAEITVPVRKFATRARESNDLLPPSARKALEDLGPKGRKTRQRLLTATKELLRTMSPVELTTAAISRAAHLSPATFYVYFDGAEDLIYTLCAEATEDMADVREAIASWRRHKNATRGASNFIDALNIYYDAHRTTLNVRNMEADRGNGRFLRLRLDAGTALVDTLASLVPLDRGEGRLMSQDEARARTAVLYAAIERMAATSIFYGTDGKNEHRRKALGAMLSELMDPQIR